MQKQAKITIKGKSLFPVRCGASWACVRATACCLKAMQKVFVSVRCAAKTYSRSTAVLAIRESRLAEEDWSMAPRAARTMTTAVDTNVVVALWNDIPSSVGRTDGSGGGIQSGKLGGVGAGFCGVDGCPRPDRELCEFISRSDGNRGGVGFERRSMAFRGAGIPGLCGTPAQTT